MLDDSCSQEKPLVTNQEQDDYTNDRYCIMKSQHGCPPGEGELGWSDSCQVYSDGKASKY